MMIKDQSELFKWVAAVILRMQFANVGFGSSPRGLGINNAKSLRHIFCISNLLYSHLKKLRLLTWGYHGVVVGNLDGRLQGSEGFSGNS
jgi:hypothetical protein